MFIGNSYIPSLLHVFLKTSLFLEFLWWLILGLGPLLLQTKVTFKSPILKAIPNQGTPSAKTFSHSNLFQAEQGEEDQC